ncbi:uncharacterized protein GGS25DRAFT_513720 [Hypoxylon fragiforme]|uniref:uncharacterized protein n=1 Tax=Hypoxylon fragiforme TaxID=63214 RepID=UPI0020C6B93A|nr:uncharacterized protein GGS25DRAFT_513720 [Hypoxylon fragiforme]KAI2609434.1 hypothetical protein GGS25DRAFT_513720 [Hypoxylon fragiforme]
MAIDEEASLWPTENLILKDGRKHYCTSVSPIHWQLRSLISAVDQDVVLFPSGANNTHITRLNTTTRECETIKVISFHPRCLVASDGWICCGGENGEFAIIRETTGLDNPDEEAVRSAHPRLNWREPSNMAEGSMAAMAQIHRDMLGIVDRVNNTNRTWSASRHKFGTERVNCITLWNPPKKPSVSGEYDSSVAVLANNDKTINTVSIYSPVLMDEIEYPDCVNRGVISPDGLLLAAVCDDPYLYIHVRRPSIKYHDATYPANYEWAELPRIRLKGQWNMDTTDCRGSFAVCFSSSGKYLAVGTQYGTISVFDAVALRDPASEPLITYFNSDRAPGEYGAVRDMAFSPGPHDLLAWTEHRGRIGIADARTNFRRRQIISLNAHENFSHFSLNDRSTIDPRLLDPRSERNTASERNTTNERTSGTSPLLEILGRWNSSRPLPNPEPSDATSRLNQPFSTDEIAILEALQSERRRRNEPRDRDRDRDRIGQRDRAVDRDQHQNQRANGDYAHETRTQRETLTRIIERERTRENREQHRSGGTNPTPPEQDRERRAPTPRRRSSIMQALTQNADNLSQAGNRTQGQGTENGDSTRATHEHEQPPWQPPWLSGRFSSGWTDLDNLANMSGGDGGANENSRTESSRTRRGIPVIADVWANDSLFSRVRMGNREHQQNPDDTAGLSWSEDGRILYIGAEDGVYEFRVNMHSRKVFPDITLR